MTAVPGLAEFLEAYPQMTVRPARYSDLVLRGRFAFVAEHPAAGQIADIFDLRIEVPTTFPTAIPRVTETGGRIPRDGSYHVNRNDETFCLGSPISLLLKLAKAPTLSGFASTCLIPYLYAVSHKLAHGGPFIFGELAHAGPGLLVDYMKIFQLKKPEQVVEVLRLLGIKKRMANKRPCLCGCRLRLGRCRFNRHLAVFRSLARRQWFRDHADTLSLNRS